MKKFLLITAMALFAIIMSAQSYTQLTVRVDARIPESGGHTQINLPKAIPATIEYFIDVSPEGEVQVGSYGTEVSYTTSSDGTWIEIVINNLVYVSEGYYIAGQVYWPQNDLPYSWYLNGEYIEEGTNNLFGISYSTLEIRLD